MKKLVSTLTAILGISTLAAQDVVVKGPDEKLQLAVFVQNETKPCYSVSYNGKTMLEKSPLGMNTNIGDFTKNLKLTGHSVDKIDTVYQQTRIKVSNVHYRANELTCHLAYIIHSGFISGYQNRYGDNLKPPTNVYHRMTA